MTVSVNVPRGVFAVVFTVILDELGATTEVGLNATVVPAGCPETKSETRPENPRSDEIDTEYVAVRPNTKVSIWWFIFTQHPQTLVHPDGRPVMSFPSGSLSGKPMWKTCPPVDL